MMWRHNCTTAYALCVAQQTSQIDQTFRFLSFLLSFSPLRFNPFGFVFSSSTASSSNGCGDKIDRISSLRKPFISCT